MPRINLVAPRVCGLSAEYTRLARVFLYLAGRTSSNSDCCAARPWAASRRSRDRASHVQNRSRRFCRQNGRKAILDARSAPRSGEGHGCPESI